MTGNDHDKFCEYHGETMYGTRPCTCDHIARIRADEREQAVERVKDLQPVMWNPVESVIAAAIRGEQS